MPSRAYTVCKCGSWVFTDRIGEGKLEFCRSCGKRWPGITPKPRADPGPQARIWKPAFRKPRGRVADQSPEGPVQRALHSLWDKMSPELKQELTAAGVKPSPPPGLTAVKGPKVNDEQAEAAKTLWESASEAQKKLLRQVGVMEPVVSAPTDLAALCKKHQEALPPSIQKALAELDPPAPTQTQQIENATKRFKQSTTELRQMIQQTASLQLKIDRAKAAYQELLEKMKVCQSELQSKQAEVTAMQSELESTIRADAGGLTDPKPDPFEGLLETLAKAGIRNRRPCMRRPAVGSLEGPNKRWRSRQKIRMVCCRCRTAHRLRTTLRHRNRRIKERLASLARGAGVESLSRVRV